MEELVAQLVTQQLQQLLGVTHRDERGLPSESMNGLPLLIQTQKDALLTAGGPNVHEGRGATEDVEGRERVVIIDDNT